MVTLSFWWSNSPFIFMKVMRVLVSALRSLAAGGSFHTSTISSSSPRTQDGLARPGDSGDNLGLKRNKGKGMWEPAQVVDHLGLQVDLS